MRTPAGGGIVIRVDEGQPIAYQLLETGVPVITSDGEQIGTVGSVLTARGEDIFHGILIDGGHHIRFVAAEAIESIHERGVDLRIDAAAAEQLPGPEHASPTYSEDPDKQQAWRHWVHIITGRQDWDHRR